MSRHLKLMVRVEGHAVYQVDLEDGRLLGVRFAPVEGARLFESWLRGRHYEEAPLFASRICGFCPVSHNLASIKTVEDAFGITPSEQTVTLRKLMNYGETLQSHCVHVFFLSLPDLLGAESAFALLDKHGETVRMAVEFREHSNFLIEMVGGRVPHPLSATVGGFRRTPTKTQLEEAARRLKTMKEQVSRMVEFFARLKVPAFTRETEYVGLQSPSEYGLYDGDIASTRGLKIKPNQYLSHFEEEVRDYSTAKFYRRAGSPFMVGALARLNLNFSQLSEDARKAAETLNVKPPVYNSFHNTTAQLVEMVHCVDESMRLVDELLSRGVKDEKFKVEVKAGEGVGSVEAPRGTLIHHYRIGGDGLLQDVNIITPTAFNLSNVEADMEALVRSNLDRPREEIARLVEALIRAYDPCVSCSVHLVKR